MIDVYRPPEKSDRECEYWWFDIWDRLVNSVQQAAGPVRIETGPGEIAMDPHIHSLFSHCSISQPETIICRAVNIGLSAICVMDHNDTRGSVHAGQCADDMKRRGLIPESFLVIPGVETNTSCGHIGALFVKEAFPKGLCPEQTVRLIHEAGGLAVAVHPYHSTGIKDALYDAPFDAVEVECGAVFGQKLVRMNAALVEDPRLSGIAKFGASDAHYVNSIGTCYTVMKLSDPTLDKAQEAIANGNCLAKASQPCRRIRKLLGGVNKLD
ncbi:MAG: PHP-associated domain-containing protein [Armatimonadota bacterium]